MRDDKAPDARPLPPGMDPERLREVLARAEPQRRKALLASLCLLLVAATLWVAMAPGFASPFGFLLSAGLLGLLLWPIFDRYWRRIAIGIVAPLLGEAWGQKSFATGKGIFDTGHWLGSLIGEESRDRFEWQGRGEYRGLDYTVSERRLTRRSEDRSMLPHVVQILSEGVRVPVPFTGRITISRRAGVLGRLDGFLRRIADADVQPQAVDPAFDALFSTLASRDASIEPLFTPAFRCAMLALAEGGRGFSGCFEDGWFHLDMRIERRAFAAARLFTPMPRLLREADALWWELTLPHRLIDALMGDCDGPLR